MRRRLMMLGCLVGLATALLVAAASYPSGVKSFTTKTDGPGRTIFAAHINDLQDEVVAIESALLNGIAHTFKPDGDVTRTLGTDTARWAHPVGTVSAPGVAFTGDSNTGIYHSGADALDFATNGTKALGIDSTQFVDSPTQPRALATKSGNQSLTDSTLTAITLDTETFDVAATHDPVTNNSRLTVPTGGDGLYLITGTAEYAANATGVRMARIKKNNTTVLNTVFVPPVTGDVTSLQVTSFVVLAAGDYVELITYQTSGGALNASANCQLAWMKVW